jgi:hypothetical protein
MATDALRTDVERNRREGASILEAHAWEEQACQEMGIVIEGKTRGLSVEKAYRKAKPGTRARALLQRAMDVYYEYICLNAKFVHWMVRKFIKSYSAVVYSDAFSGAWEGMIRGMIRWNPEKGRVISYVRGWMRVSMQRTGNLDALKSDALCARLRRVSTYHSRILPVDYGMEHRLVVADQIAFIRTNIGRLTEKQGKVVMGLLEGKNRQELEDEMGVTRQNIHDLLQRVAATLERRMGCCFYP